MDQLSSLCLSLTLRVQQTGPVPQSVSTAGKSTSNKITEGGFTTRNYLQRGRQWVGKLMRPPYLKMYPFVYMWLW